MIWMEAEGLVDLRRASTAVRAQALVLNAAAEVETSPLDAPRLEAMLEAAALAPGRVEADALVAFLIAFDQGAAYDNSNFRWFQARTARFLYVDRVLVAPAAQGRGLARALYAVAFAHAAARELSEVVCEVNLTPPNPASAAFHAALGFEEAGRAALAGGKVVRYLRRSVAGDVDADGLT